MQRDAECAAVLFFTCRTKAFTRMPANGEAQMPSTEPLAYAPKQAAQVIGIGLTALYAEIKTGRIKPRKFGRRTLISATDLRQWLDALPTSKREAA